LDEQADIGANGNEPKSLGNAAAGILGIESED
jgi:hypothetical protein